MQTWPRQAGAFVGPLVGGQVLGRPSEAPQRPRALWLAAGTQEKEPVRIDAARRNFTTASTSNSSNKAGGSKEGDGSIGRAKALAKPTESRAAQLREAKAKERATTKKSTIPNPFEIPIKAGRAARRALEALGKVDEPPTNPDAYRLYFDQKFLYAVPKPNETTPTVLVVGATGETGRQVVRKLVLKGYRVQVLVRNLYSTTLNLLGSGVSYSKGELTDLPSLRSACDGVDKVVYVAQARNETESRAVEFQGLRNLAKAFLDTRITTKGKRVMVKRTLFKFRKAVDRDVWSATPPTEAGVSSSWTVEDTLSGRPTFRGSFAAGVSPEKAVAMLESKEISLNLGKFCGMLAFFKATGNPQTTYRFVVRTGLYAKQGIQYELPLVPDQNRFLAFRMNFKDFVPVKDGMPYLGPGSAALDPADVRQFAIIAQGSPSADAESSFALTLEGVKVLKASPQPDVVVLSSSDINSQMTPRGLKQQQQQQGEGSERVERRNYFKAMGELALKNSGLNYCIVRISDFTSSPGEGRPLSVSRNGNNMGLITRADAAEVCVNCLFSSQVTNSEIYASENPRYGERDIARLLEQLDAPF